MGKLRSESNLDDTQNSRILTNDKKRGFDLSRFLTKVAE
jgi:hypothetical protein